MTRRSKTTATDTWQPRPLLSVVMRIVIYGIPLFAGLGISNSLGQVIPGTWNPWLVLGLRAVAAVAASMIVASATARLLPLALLLKMTMIFPDVAPSRLAVARRTTSVKELTRRLEHGEPTEREAATTMLALVAALDRHDRKTRGHSERVRLFCDLLGAELGLDQAARGRLRWAALVHDVGKLQVSERVLNKPSSLSDSEWVLIKAHPDAGARLAQPLAAWLGQWFAGIAEHHERFDGTGYPQGLAGEEISLAGRAIAVVDAFETMTAARAYKSPMSTWSARSELARCAGTHFDPVVVRAFLRIALPRVLRVVGPLAFLINAPLLKIVGQAPVRVIDAAALGASNAMSAAGVTAVAVAVSAAPVGAVERPPSHAVVFAATQQVPGSPRATTGATPRVRPPVAASTSAAPTPSPRPRAKTNGKAEPTPVRGAAKAPVAPEPHQQVTAKVKDKGENSVEKVKPDTTEPTKPPNPAPAGSASAPPATPTPAPPPVPELLPVPVPALPPVPAPVPTASLPTGPVSTLIGTVLGQLPPIITNTSGNTSGSGSSGSGSSGGSGSGGNEQRQN